MECSNSHVKERPRVSGFTLLELSIVLSIIALIVGGIVVGQTLLHTAELRSTISQLDRFNAATTAFFAKYSCLPGDCANASRFNFTTASPASATVNGDGNGFVFGPTVAGYTSDGSGMEARNYWAQLEQAGFIGDTIDFLNDTATTGIPGVDSPHAKIVVNVGLGQNRFAGGWWVVGGPNAFQSNPSQLKFSSQTLSNYFLLTGSATGAGVNPVIRNFDAESFDAKIDDGLPYSGSVMAMGSAITALGYSLNLPSNGDNTHCVNTTVTPNIYGTVDNLSGGAGCNLVIVAGF